MRKEEERELKAQGMTQLVSMEHQDFAGLRVLSSFAACLRASLFFSFLSL